jgi:L-lactate utilization protein LutB
MSTDVIRLADQYGLFLCVECGKCVAICPMGEIFDDFSYEASPRGIIEKALLDSEILEDNRLWFCLTCDLCSNLCPAGVHFRDFVQAVRVLTLEAGVMKYSTLCHRCGKYLWPRHTVEHLKKIVGEFEDEFLTLCPKCRQYDFGEKVKMLASGNRILPIQKTENGESQ